MYLSKNVQHGDKAPPVLSWSDSGDPARNLKSLPVDQLGHVGGGVFMAQPALKYPDEDIIQHDLHCKSSSEYNY